MCSNNSITEILGISDKNLKIIGNNYENIKGIRYMIIDSQITYTPTACSKCGCVNEDYSIVKNGNKTVKVLINRAGNNPVILRIKKQRFYCKHCESTFIAETTLTEKGCFISKDVKKSIVKELCEFKSMKLIAREHYVSSNTVVRVLRSTEIKNSKKYLPEAIGIDEFKSLKNVDASMSVNITDLETNKIFDIVPDRRKGRLRQYFLSYPVHVREKVKIITMDMYDPYFEIAKELFPNAEIIIDKFHIVQLLNRSLNKYRILIMKGLHKKSHGYKISKTYWKLPLAKHWKLDRIHFFRYKHYKKFISKYDILQDILSLDEGFKYTYEFYQNFLVAIENKDIDLLCNIINTPSESCPDFFRVHLKSLRKRIHYVINSIKYNYTNAVVEGKNNMIKVFKRVSFGFRSYRNMRARILLRERVKIK